MVEGDWLDGDEQTKKWQTKNAVKKYTFCFASFLRHQRFQSTDKLVGVGVEDDLEKTRFGQSTGT